MSIYTTTKNLEILRIKKRLLSDETFNCAPIGKQLYTIHAVVDASKMLPLVYCITSNKDDETYEEIFEFLKERNLYPESVTADFEIQIHLSMVVSSTSASVCGKKFKTSVYKAGIQIRKIHS